MSDAWTKEQVQAIVSEQFKPWAYQHSMSIQSAMHQATEASLKCLSALAPATDRSVIEEVRAAYRAHDKALADYFAEYGVEHETYSDDEGGDHDCPEDDNCECPLLVAMRETERAMRAALARLDAMANTK